MAIRVVYSKEPNFPATDQHPDAVRFFITGLWVDAVGVKPTDAEVTAFVTGASISLDSFVADPDRIDLITRLRNATPAQIKTYVQNNVTDLASAKLLLAKILLAIALQE